MENKLKEIIILEYKLELTKKIMDLRIDGTTSQEIGALKLKSLILDLLAITEPTAHGQ